MEIETHSTPCDPKMDFDALREAETYSASNFKNTKDPNFAPASKIGVEDVDTVTRQHIGHMSDSELNSE